MTSLKLLSVSTAKGRAGYVFLIGRELTDWRLSVKAATSPEEAAEHAQRWINRLRPDVVVTERFDRNSRKSDKSRAIIDAVARTADHNQLLAMRVRRERRYANKQFEAEALATEFPDIAPWLPARRPFYETEARSLVLFEALALATQPWNGGVEDIAAALG